MLTTPKSNQRKITRSNKRKVMQFIRTSRNKELSHENKEFETILPVHFFKLLTNLMRRKSSNKLDSENKIQRSLRFPWQHHFILCFC